MSDLPSRPHTSPRRTPTRTERRPPGGPQDPLRAGYSHLHTAVYDHSRLAYFGSYGTDGKGMRLNDENVLPVIKAHGADRGAP